MEYYDKMASGVNVPFAMLSGPLNYKSKYINTDKNGFRFTKFNEQYISIDDINRFEEVNILVGGSTVFGVGSTSDDTTITSYLSQATGEVWLNMGIRGGVSLTEYIHLIRFIYKAKRVKNIIFFSGINDIYINQLTDKKNNFDNLFNSINSGCYSCKRRFISSIFSKIYNTNKNNLIDKSLKEIIFYPKYKNHFSEKILTEDEKLNLTVENFKRNFFLYSALQKELNCNIVYIFQPFTDWTDKIFSKEEELVFEELEKLQQNSKWVSHRNKLSRELYNNLVKSFSEISNSTGVKFKDSHEYFNNEKTLFVDAVHLSDEGNKLVSNLIQDISR
jgi:lysophospholipase L1-like esterase